MITPEQYRAHYLSADISQWRFALALFATANVAFMWFDFRQYGWSPMFQGLIAVRVVQIAYSAWLWQRLPRVLEAQHADRLIVAWCALGVLTIFINAIARPPEYYGHYIFEVFALLVFFASIPLPANKQLMIAGCYLVFAVAVLFSHKKPPITLYTSNVLFVLILTVASGYLISLRIHRYRMSALTALVKLEKQARTDPLTGIANRRAFMDWVAVELSRHNRFGKAITVLTLDIDDFKAINDRHGYNAGDLLLVDFAQRILAHLRPYDEFARLSGEEFAVVLPDCPLDKGILTAERLRACVSARPFMAGAVRVPMTISIGVTRVIEGEVTIDRALQRADLALYGAKVAGRNRVQESE